MIWSYLSPRRNVKNPSNILLKAIRRLKYYLPKQSYFLDSAKRNLWRRSVLNLYIWSPKNALTPGILSEKVKEKWWTIPRCKTRFCRLEVWKLPRCDIWLENFKNLTTKVDICRLKEARGGDLGHGLVNRIIIRAFLLFWT